MMVRAANKQCAYYAVARGRQIGIYRNWPECQEQVVGFQNPRYKKFQSEAEALEFIETHRAPGGPPVMVGMGNYMQSPQQILPQGDAASALLNLFNISPCTSMVQSSQATPPPTNPRKRQNTNLAPPLIASKRYRQLEGVDFGDAQIVYTDGACSRNGASGSKAGYGVWWGDNHQDNECGPVYGEQTNNRGELIAVIQAIRKALQHGYQKLIVRTDSQLLINSMDKWIEKWKRNGWKTADGGAVKNRDLLEKLDELLDMCLVKFEHVPGHAGIRGNEMADALARNAANNPMY